MNPNDPFTPDDFRFHFAVQLIGSALFIVLMGLLVWFGVLP